MTKRRVRARYLIAMAGVTFSLAALYGAVQTDVIGAVRRWGEEMRPLQAMPAHVVINGFPVGPPVVCEPRRSRDQRLGRR